MLNNITLTSSMRSNLYALKNLTTQMNKTQNRLASGLKVNSAIDNASSYYQARALNNRASDLDMLLDAMGQSIQTISTAVKGLEKSGEMLEQAAVIAQEAYEAAIIPEKAWFEAQVGPNGAVVTTAQELKDAVNSGKETICVYGKIDYFENQAITMKAGQKLVGTEYFTGYTGNKKFSQIIFNNNIAKWGIIMASDSMISDLYIERHDISKNSSAIYVFNQNNVVINNIDIDGECNSDNTNRYYSGLYIQSSIVDLTGNININLHRSDDVTAGYSDFFGINIHTGSKVYINDKLNIRNMGRWSIGVWHTSNSEVFFLENSEYNFYNENGTGSCFHQNGSNNSYAYISQSAKINSNKALSDRENQIIFEDKTNSWNYDPNMEINEDYPFNYNKTDDIVNKQLAQYATVMNSFDEIVEDSSYQGVNLITGGSLTTMFNENRTHSFVVQGEDMRAESLGIVTREWNTRDDIAQSIKEIKAAMGKVRDMVESLGNNLSIIQTRENFTDKLIDVLETGADDLVLADMNEESANYLALQTRNNLAVNALALAAQSGNAVLKLF